MTLIWILGIIFVLILMDAAVTCYALRDGKRREAAFDEQFPAERRRDEQARIITRY